MNADKGKSKGKFYHPFAALPRATEGTEEKQEKAFNAWALGLYPKNRFLVKDFICVHPRASAAKKGYKLLPFSDCTSVSSVPRA